MRTQQTRRWMHVAISYSFSPSENDFKVSLFQDGIQVEFGSEVWGLNADSEIRLGPFPGKLAELRVWDHARSAEEVEQWMFRRCQGDEPGLYCCLSLSPARALSDSTLDPGKALAAGHFFADRGVCEGEVTWDGDCPSQLRDAGAEPHTETAKPEAAPIPWSDPWSDASLARAWEWLDRSHETEVSERRRQAERRQVESEARQAEESQRKAYVAWQQEQLKQEEEEAKRKEAEEDEKQRRVAEELEKRDLRKASLRKLATWTCPFASY